MKIKMKKVGYIRLHRYIALEYKKELTDPEYRLLDIYACLVRWDKKHKDSFGTVTGLTIRGIQENHLPKWSVGKISGVIKKLIKRGFLSRLKEPKHCMQVENFWMYQATVQQAEQGFHLIEQRIQPTEHNIQLAEQKQKEELQNGIAEIVEKYTPFKKNVQSTKQSESG